MTTVIRILDEYGRETRRCDGRCHRADPGKPSRCLCDGMLRGCERDGASIDWARVQHVAELVALNPGESIQMRIGA